MGEKRCMPVRTARIDLEGEFEGWYATVRINPMFETYEQLQSEDLGQVKEALGGLLREPWNFVDEEGEPMSSPDTAAIGKMPLELIAEILKHLNENMALPKTSSAE